MYRTVLQKTGSMLTRSMTTAPNYVVKHDKYSNKFYIQLQQSAIAIIEYEKLGNVLNFYETLVPEPFQGRGIGKVLAKAAFDYAIDHNQKIQLSCTYLQKYYHENYELYKNYVLDEELDTH